MARLRIDWRASTQIAPKAVTTGQSEGEEAPAAAAMRAARPMMVYVVSDDATDSATRKLEDVVFANEAVGIGSKLFDTIKMTPGDAAQDRLISESGRDLPRIVFLTREYEVTDVLQGKRISAGRLLKAMKNLARKEYENNFERMIRDYTKLLNELDRLEGRKAKLADDAARLQAKPNPSKQKRLERDQKELEEDYAKLQEEEKTLLEIQLKDEEKASA